MDALKALAGQQGCSADGTAASQNPLSQFVNRMGKDGRQIGPQIGGPRPQQPGSELENAMAAGMGIKAGPQISAPPMHPNLMANEFSRMQQTGTPRGPIIKGPDPASINMMNQQQMGDNWVQQFENMSMGPRAQHAQNVAMQQQFQRNFGTHGPPQMGQRWINQMAARPMRPGNMDMSWRAHAPQTRVAQNWTQQMKSDATPDAQQWANQAKEMVKEAEIRQQEAIDADAIRKATEDLVNVMSSDEKFRKSNFYQEMSKVAAGDSVITENEIKQVRESEPNLLERTENELKSIFEKAYEAQLAGQDVDLDAVFNQAFSEQNSMNSVFENVWNQNSQHAKDAYELQQDNKFGHINDEERLFELGMELFRKGELRDAILAFEAVVDKDISNSEAWRMLGVVHQELDEDRKAIVCLETAREQDPYNLNALLELGVSYVNELDQSKALSNLKAWVDSNPRFTGIKVDDIYGDDSNDLMHDVMMLMTKVEEFAPNDPEVQVVLGVLYNVSRDYDQAVAAFKNALNHKPDDYSLWNKLGATLANSSKSEEALPVYTRAIELKPKYARGWLNFGISHSNLGDYSKAIRAYLRALDLNPDATHIWNYLRICLTCTEGYEHLFPAVENRNIEAFRQVFDF